MSQRAREEASGTHCKLGEKKANVTAAKHSQVCCKIFNAQRAKSDNFIRAIVKVMYDKGKAHLGNKSHPYRNFSGTGLSTRLYKSRLKHKNMQTY